MTELYDWRVDGLDDDPEADAETVTDVPAAVDTGRPVDPPDDGGPAGRRPVYATITDRGQPARRPLLPAWLRSGDDAWTTARTVVGARVYTACWHATRSGKYAAKVALWAPVGVAVVVWLAPAWVRWTVAAVLLLVLARVGRPADRPILDTVVAEHRPRKLTAEAVRQALTSLGIAAVKRPESVTFPTEISRDGPGYLATVDLPHGVTAAEVIDRRAKLASALRVPVDQCWPETVAGQHAGRLALWVADEPVSQMRQPGWPLAKTGQVDVFRPFPFGTDPRKRPVTVTLMWRNVLVGGVPGAGKTGALRLLLLAASLDARVELRGYELKGSGDLDVLTPVCTEYGSGPDDDTTEAALGMLRWARRECTRRAAAVKRYAAAGKAPENKVTPQLAGMPDGGLHPVVLFVDEAQELFAHDRYGREAGELATQVIKLGRALGVILLLGTQRPDKDSLPTGVSGNVNTRFCLRVMGQTENDLILGTSAYRNGIRSTQWTDRDLGWGWLGGVGDPVACHAYYLDNDAAKRVTTRAVAARGGPVERTDLEPGVRHDLVADVRAVWPDGHDAVWSEELTGRLAQLRGEVYAGWDVATLNGALRAAGVPVAQLHRKVDGRGITRYGVRCDQLPAPDCMGGEPARRREVRDSIARPLDR